jgi:hypothetical protein
MENNMNKDVSQAVAIFIAMGLIYAVLAFIASGVEDTFGRSLMISTGSAILGAGLTFFLLRMFQVKK